jgi:hypothetical protein
MLVSFNRRRRFILLSRMDDKGMVSGSNAAARVVARESGDLVVVARVVGTGYPRVTPPSSLPPQ